MGTISPTLPSVGDPRGSEEVDLRNALVALLDEFNGNIEAANMAGGGVGVATTGTGDDGLARGAFSAYRSSALTIPQTTATPIVFDAEEFDVSSWYDTSTGRFTPQVAGIYRLSALVRISGEVAGWSGTEDHARVYVRKNGSAEKQIHRHQGNTAAMSGAAGSALLAANGSTDYFEVVVYRDSFGANLAVEVGGAYCWFQGELVGRT